MKRFLPFFLIGLLCSAGFTACQSTQPAPAQEQPKDTLVLDSLRMRIGYLPTLDALPLLVAQERGWIDSLHIDLDLVPYTSNMDIDTALVRKRLHGALTDVCRAILLNAQDDELRIVAHTDGVSRLVSQRQLRINRMKDLKERMVAISRNEATDWLLDLWINQESTLTLDDVSRPQIHQVPLRMEMVDKEMVDAAVLPEPWASQAAVHQNRLLASSQDLRVQTGCWVMYHKALVNFDTQLRHLATIYNLAAQLINESPKGSFDPLIQRSFAVDALATDTLQLPTYQRLTLPDKGTLEQATQWLGTRYDEQDWLGFRILPAHYKADHLTDDRLVNLP